MTTSHLFSAKIASLLTMSPRLQWLLIYRRSVLDQNTLWADARAGQYARLVDGLISPLMRGGRMMQAVCFQFEKENHLLVIHREMCLAVILSDPGELLDEIASRALAVLEECDQVIRRTAGIEPELSAIDEKPKVELASVTTEELPVAEVPVAKAITEEVLVAKVQVAKPLPAVVRVTKTQVANIKLAPALAEVAVQEREPEPAVAASSDDEPAWKAFRTQLIEVIGKILSRPQAERLLVNELSALGIQGIPTPADFERIGRDVVAHVPHRSKQAALLAEVLHFLKS